jgi:hypothetical protein
MRRDFSREEFQSDVSTEFSVLCSVYFAHSSRTDLANDTIPGQRSSGGKFSHESFLRHPATMRKNKLSLLAFNARKQFNKPGVVAQGIKPWIYA